MAARKGIRAKVLTELAARPMTGYEIERMYLDLGGSPNKHGRVSFDTLRHLLNGMPVKASEDYQGRSRMLGRTYTLDPEELQREIDRRDERKRAKQLLLSLLDD